MAMTFDTVSETAIILGKPSELTFESYYEEFTLMGWIKPMGEGTIIGRRDSNLVSYQLGVINASYNLFANLGNGYSEGTTALDDGNLHHGAVVNFDDSGTKKFQLYLDGITEGSVITTGTQLSSADILIGARRGISSTTFAFVLSGVLEDIRVYNRALKVSEIETIYGCKGCDGIKYGLIGRWPLNERAVGQVA